MTVSRTRARVSVAFGLLHSELTLKEPLLELRLGNLNLDSLIHLLRMSALVIRIVLDGSREESIDESRLS